MPKTNTKRMEGWKGKAYDPSAWETDPQVSYAMRKIIESRPEIKIVNNDPEIRVGNQSREHTGRYSKGSKK